MHIYTCRKSPWAVKMMASSPSSDFATCMCCHASMRTNVHAYKHVCIYGKMYGFTHPLCVHKSKVRDPTMLLMCTDAGVFVRLGGIRRDSFTREHHMHILRAQPRKPPEAA